MAAILPPFTNAKILMADMISSWKTHQISQRNSPIARSLAAQEVEFVVKPKKKGHPKKGEEKPTSELTRIEKQKRMTLEEMLNDLPKACDKGAKKDSKGNIMYWTGYKLHLDTIDGGIPVSCKFSRVFYIKLQS